MKEISTELLKKINEAAQAEKGKKTYQKYMLPAEMRNEKGKWIFIGWTYNAYNVKKAYTKTVRDRDFLYVEVSGDIVRYELTDEVKKLMEELK